MTAHLKTYFARPEGRETPIKIGYSWNPDGRMYDLRWNGLRCELIAAINGNFEGKLHARFADWHEGREWFTANRDLLDFIEAAIAHNAAVEEFAQLLDALPTARRLTPNGGRPKGHIGKFAAVESA